MKQRRSVYWAWFGIWAVIIGALAWLLGEPPNRVWYEALLGGLGALGAFQLLN
jgi:hypothetical protein